MSCQVYPTWTPIRKAYVFASLSIHASSSPTKRKTPLDVGFLPWDDESTRGDNEDNGNDRLIAPTLPSALSQPTKDPVRSGVNKAGDLYKCILSLRCLLSDLQSRHAALSESTYHCEWQGSWPANLRKAYKSYKSHDSVWRDLQEQLTKHRSTHGNVRPGSRPFDERLHMMEQLGVAAVRTSKGRLEFLDRYMCAFARYEQVGTHIHEGSKALRSAEHAMMELTLMSNLPSTR
ncbi:hypothetical protein V8C26DRAFT_423807 [Trichoderma gracile]